MIEVRGQGLHSGREALVRLHPSEGPVRFRVFGQEFRPLASMVQDTTRCTVIGSGGLRVATVEHLLAALFLKNFWYGLVVEVEGPELPILDGSAQEWLALLERFQPEPVTLVGLGEPVRIAGNGGAVSAEPADEFALAVTVVFPHPQIGYQSFVSPPETLSSVAAARTFGFLKDLEALRSQGLAHGASLDNTLVFSESSFLNPPRFPDEPVRHKALDFLGDLYLAGAPFAGRFTVHRGSHRLHLELAKVLELRAGERLASRAG